MDSVNITRLGGKKTHIWGNFERHLTCSKCCESETCRNRLGVLKVTPQPQMSLTTILIKGDSFGENRIEVDKENSNGAYYFLLHCSCRRPIDLKALWKLNEKQTASTSKQSQFGICSIGEK